jgi:CTP:molybdopterin cytidylyltransferase MocA
MTLMDEPCPGSTPHEFLSNPARGDRPRVSVVIPVGKTSDLTSTLERLPDLGGEVIVVGPPAARGDVTTAGALRPDVRVTHETADGDGDGAALRAGFAAARGECIVVLGGDFETDAREIQRFVTTLQAACSSLSVL